MVKPTTTPAGPAGGTVWSPWHLHLASDAGSLHDRVVNDVVGPTVGAVGDRPWFFIRYWQAGPHVRVRIGDLDEQSFEFVEESLRKRLEVAGKLAADEHPVTRAGYRGGAERFAAGERGTDRVVHELLPPGVYRARYEPEYDRYGGAGLMPRTERLFQLSSELAVGMLPHLSSPGRRAALALRATMSAAAALGDATEPAAFYAHGLAAWRARARDLGLPGEQVDLLGRQAGAAGAAGSGVDPTDHGVFGPWHAAVAALVAEIRRTGGDHPGRIVSSHVHMFHNRLGLGVLEELRTYAWLAGSFPIGAVRP
jgi:thiopeptide-type bacteriocin biosynthesis protein